MCNRLRLEEGSRARLLATSVVEKDLARAVRYFPRAVIRAGEWTRCFNIHCLLFYATDHLAVAHDFNLHKMCCSNLNIRRGASRDGRVNEAYEFVKVGS